MKSSISYYEASSATASVMPAMMEDVSLVEEEMENFTKLWERLANYCQQQDMVIAQLLNRFDNYGETSHAASN